MNKLTQTLWKLFLVTFPFSVHFVLYEKASYRFGNFSPWVTGFLFLPELLLLLIFSLWFIGKIRSHELPKFEKPSWGLILFILFVLNAGLVTLFQSDLVLYLFFLIRVLEAGAVFILIRAKLIPHAELIRWLLYGAVFQVVLAYTQTRLNHSVGLHVLGEPIIGPEVSNVAKTDLPDGSKVIRPYGTFLHPNILGVYLLTMLTLCLAYLKKSALPFWIILLSVGIYMTGSQAAQITVLAAVAVIILLGALKKARQKRILSLGLLTIILAGNLWIYNSSAAFSWQYTSLQERLDQNAISLNMFRDQFWGVGVGNFTLEMEKYSQSKLMPWEFQPVHNAYFLVLNETGWQGLMLLLLMITHLLHGYWKTGLSYFLRDKARILPLFGLIILASFDHLLWTSWVGLVLVGMVVAETTRPT